MDKENYYKFPLIMRNLRKVFITHGGEQRTVALSNISLRIEKGEIFGMVGPAKSGKTTLIQCLSGLLEATTGHAWIKGYEIKHQLEVIQLMMGVCFQEDILWDDLTVYEHLLFFARIKGIPILDEHKVIR